jgi:hypothetical protein
VELSASGDVARPCSSGLGSDVPARTVLHDDFVRRCALHHRAAAYVISALLRPCFKDYAFIDDYSFVDSSDMAWALADAALSEWRTRRHASETTGGPRRRPCRRETSDKKAA